MPISMIVVLLLCLESYNSLFTIPCYGTALAVTGSGLIQRGATDLDQWV
jgi:hypothetical protein